MKFGKFTVEVTVTMVLSIRQLETSFLLHNKGEMAKGSQLFNLPQFPQQRRKLLGI